MSSGIIGTPLKNRGNIILVIVFSALIISIFYMVIMNTDPENVEKSNNIRLIIANQTDLEDCYYVHSSCPFIKLDQKLDRIIELLEKEN